MSRNIAQPVGQKRLTNIAVVRLKKGGTRFEIACYKNKVGDWRSGVEKELDEVLQTTTVFLNVGKGTVAKEKELQAAFGTTDQEKICLEILARGELQVSEKERKMDFDNLFKDVAGVLVEKCINPDTQRPYTLTMLERALRDIHFNCDPKKSAKQQALEALPLLQERFPIQRARMRLRLQAPQEHRSAILDHLDALDIHIEGIEAAAGGAAVAVVLQTDPGAFRPLHDFLQAATQRQGRLEVVNMAVTSEGMTADEFNVASAAALPPAAAAAPAAPAPPAPRPAPEPAAPAGPPPEPAGRSRKLADDQLAGSEAAAAATAAAGTSGRLVGDVLYPRGPVAGLPEEFASRRERFIELDTLQAGWEVELKSKGETVDAVFYAPNGQKVGAFANARRAALAAHKAAAVS